MAHPILNGVYQYLLDQEYIKHHEKIMQNSDSILIYCFPSYCYPTSASHPDCFRPWTINNTYINLSMAQHDRVRMVVSKKDLAECTRSSVNMPWYGISVDTLIKEFNDSRPGSEFNHESE